MLTVRDYLPALGRGIAGFCVVYFGLIFVEWLRDLWPVSLKATFIVAFVAGVIITIRSALMVTGKGADMQQHELDVDFPTWAGTAIPFILGIMIGIGGFGLVVLAFYSIMIGLFVGALVLAVRVQRALRNMAHTAG